MKSPRARLAALIFTLVWSAFVSSAAESALWFGGVPVELKFTAVSERTLRIESSPLDAQGKPQAATPSPVLVQLPALEKLSVRELAAEQEVRIRGFRLSLKPHPLTVTVRREDGKVIQE